MYRYVVARKVRATFDAINAGNWQVMVDGMAPRFTYVFYGSNALSGERHTKAALALWWQRIFRLFPGATFQVADLVVGGWPWRTTVATAVGITVPRDGGPAYRNVFHQMLTLRWGRVTEVRTLEDTAVLDRELARLSAAGVGEAVAAPIVDAG